MKKFIAGIVCGAFLMLTTSVFAEDGLEKISAYLRPGLPIKLDGEKIQLKNAPIIYEGTTYLPLRETASIMDKDVSWNEEAQTVELRSKKVSSPAPTDGTVEANEDDGGKIMDLIKVDETTYKYDDTIYIPIGEGGDKYGVKNKVIFSSSNKTISFKGTDIVVPFIDSFEPNCEAFYDERDGRTYIKEEILIRAKAAIEKVQQ